MASPFILFNFLKRDFLCKPDNDSKGRKEKKKSYSIEVFLVGIKIRQSHTKITHKNTRHECLHTMICG